MRALLAAALLLAVGAPAAAAAPGYEVGMEDERLLLDSPARAGALVEEWKAAGVDVVRLHARWVDVAPARRGARNDWSELDRAIAAVEASGLKLMLTVTGPGPLWTSRVPSRGNALYKPDPRLFGAFARSVADRYARAVDRYLIWNEPNQPGWLQPQFECSRRGCAPASPHLYRSLFKAARSAIRGQDPSAEIVAGELAPVGRRGTSANVPVAPLPFLRALGCVDARYRPLRGGACSGFEPLRADAFGHHPHGVQNGPEDRTRVPGEAKIADLPKYFRVLDRLTARGRLIPPGRRFEVHLTEFGYQTSPPDHVTGVSVARQSQYLQQAAYIAWRNPRIRSLVHYQWEDEPTRYAGPGTFAYAGWQSGLLYITGEPKPAYESFLRPFVIDRSPGSSRARFWGQVRPGEAHAVELLYRRPGRSAFTRVTTTRTNAAGEWSLSRSAARGDYRFRTAGATSAAATLGRRARGRFHASVVR